MYNAAQTNALERLEKMKGILRDLAKKHPASELDAAADEAVWLAEQCGIPDAASHRQALYLLHAYLLQEGMLAAIQKLQIRALDKAIAGLEAIIRQGDHHAD